MAESADPGNVDLGALRYEQLVELLESLTRQMSSGEVGIEEATQLYEQAGVVYRAAADRLASVTERLAAIGEPTPVTPKPTDPN